MRFKTLLSVLISSIVCLANAVPDEQLSYLSCGNIRLADKHDTYVTMYANSYEGECKLLRAGHSEKYTVNRGCTCYFHTTESCTDDANPVSGFADDTTGESNSIRAWSCEIIRKEDQAALEQCLIAAFEKAAAEHKLSEHDPSGEEGAKEQEAAKQEASEYCTKEILKPKAHGSAR